ncbi:MAG: hypothetical protein SOV90_01615 [Lachnospiraceae bacterium]|nr:hypothetical protein [Lachnospiraceae bacterium]
MRLFFAQLFMTSDLAISDNKNKGEVFVHDKVMRKYIKIEENDLEIVKCNKCGRELKVSRGTIKEGVFSIDYVWGYFSEKDGEVHSFDLCENCYDKMLKEFVIKPDIKDNNELL